MEKYLLKFLSILLLTLVLSPKSFASDSHKITTVELAKSENIYKAKVHVELLPESKISSSVLNLGSHKLAQGFQKATFDNANPVCKVDDGKVICNHELDAHNLVYEFVWQPREIIESEFCANATLEKQDNANKLNGYILKFATSSQNTYPFVHKIVIKGLTTEGNLAETYADFASDKGFAVLWATNSFDAQEKQITEVSFVSDEGFGKISKGAFANSSSYRPYSGSLTGFEAQGQYKMFILNTKKNPIAVESANLVLCKKDNIKTEKFVTNLLHEIYSNETLLSASLPSKNLIIGWNGISYDAEITPTATSTPPNTPTTQYTPTPQPTIVVSTSNLSNTQAPTVPKPKDTGSWNNDGVMRDSETQRTDVVVQNPSDLDEIDILGATDKRERNNHPEVTISPVTLRDPFYKNVNKTTIPVIFPIIFVFLLISCFLILLRKFSRKSLATIYLSRKAYPKDVEKKSIFAIIFGAFRKLVGMSVFLIFVVMFARPAAAQTAYTSKKITNAFTMHGTGLSTGVMHVIFLQVTKTATPGKYVISRNPDGTGDMEVGNYLQAIVRINNFASTRSFYVGPKDDLYLNHFICPDKTTVPPQDVSAWFPYADYYYEITFRFITSCRKDFPVSDLYLVFIPDPTPTPSATPTSTQTPTPTPFAPFLDLPWDYRSKGLSFSSAATSMTSYFDHEYPLLSSSVVGLSDPDDLLSNFEGIKSDFSYSSHDGYDYARKSGANYGDPQLAAADGIATLHRDFWQQGNAIYIDHGNGFQTRYYHLDHKDLITSETGKKVEVKQGQMIGRVGFTGNTDPRGEGGAHIHFMVIYDKNHDGDFSDNIPDGLIDPYGWMGEEGADPWENAVFQYPQGTSRKGMRSSYLWKYKLTNTNKDIGPEGGELLGDGIKIQVPQITLDQILNFHMKSVPRPPKDLQSTDSAKLEIISSVADITAKDGSGKYVRSFNNPLNIVIDLVKDVFKYYKPESISIYSSNDEGNTWQKEPTYIDFENNKAVATPNHLTLFAVMGEQKDVLPPETVINVTGSGKNGQFRSDAWINLDIKDDIDSLGIDYTLFTIDSEADWREYMAPINVASEGAHMIKAFSADRSGNLETAKLLEFVIDKTAPEITIKFATKSGEFRFTNKENFKILKPELAPVQSENKSAKVEDLAGNTNEITYAISESGGINTFRVLGGNKNGETINYKPSLYAITTSEEGDIHEYLQSDEDVTRLIVGENGEVFIIKNDEIELYMGERPLQFETEGDRLVLIKSK